MERMGYCCGNFTPENEHLKPIWCYSIPELNYVCSDEYSGSPIYRDYLRFSTCLNASKVIDEDSCGMRELYKHVEPGTSRSLIIHDKNICVWRLFDPDATNRHKSLLYTFNFMMNLNKNVEITIFSEYG